MLLRDTFKSVSYWEGQLLFVSSSIERFERSLKKPSNTPADYARLSSAIFVYRLEFLISHYSYGSDLPVLRSIWHLVLQDLPRCIAHNSDYMRWRGFDDYMISLWLLSWAILMEEDQESMQHILGWIGHPGKDALFDTIAGRFVSIANPAQSLLYKRAYKNLYLAITTDDPTRQAMLLRRFITAYLSSTQNAYWNGRHVRDDAFFMGYWCFELAAVVKLFGLSEDSVRDHMVYPKDLVR
jgi:hypothetical protein